MLLKHLGQHPWQHLEEAPEAIAVPSGAAMGAALSAPMNAALAIVSGAATAQE